MARCQKNKSSGADYVLLPGVLAGHRMLGNLEMHMALRASGRAEQGHSRLLRGAISFLDIALQASGYDILPVVRTAFRAGNDVVDRQVMPLFAAILARIRIPVQNIAPGQTDLFIRNLDVTS